MTARLQETSHCFCPTCGALLLLDNNFGLRFYCAVCPYVHQVNRKISKKVYLKRKEIDDVLGGEDAWKNVDKTQGQCGLSYITYEAFVKFIVYFCLSKMSEMRPSRGLLHADPNTISGRANDNLL